jgi:hypothetical protein
MHVALNLLLHTIVWPLALGAVLALLPHGTGPRDALLTVTAGLMIFAVYVILEGLPAIPPIAAKQKLALVMAAAIPAVFLAGKLRMNRAAVTTAMLALALLWLGWNKLSQAAAWPHAVALLAPVATGTLASHTMEDRAREPFLWPAMLLAYAAGASVLSLLGLFVGFAQAMGALAAWTGGLLATNYGYLLFGRGAKSLPSCALWVSLLSIVAASFMVGLFAPDVNPWAFAVLSLTLITPLAAPRLRGVSPLIKPFVFGLTAAMPVAAAVLIALWQQA